MAVRHREQDNRITDTGSYSSQLFLPPPVVVFASRTFGYRRVCDDEGAGDHHTPYDFFQRHSWEYYPTLTGHGSGTNIFVNYPVANKPLPPDPRTQYPLPTLLDRNNYAWEILSKTNPSAAHVSIPTFVGELKDLPGLVKGYGEGLIRAVANGYLSWRWAIKPMISDLQKLYRFQKAVDDRIQMLRKLRDGATLRRRVELGTQNADSVQLNQLVHSQGVTVRADIHLHYSRKRWGTAQWKLKPTTVLPERGAILDVPQHLLTELKRAERLTFGLTEYEFLATAWELTPWSWLIDWFSNTGDIIAACNNTVDCTYHNVCVMQHSEAIRTFLYTTGSHPFAIPCLKQQDYYQRMERKERFVCSPILPVPIPQLPMLTSGQWSILAALAAQRR
jgi:hypothetical protein